MKNLYTNVESQILQLFSIVLLVLGGCTVLASVMAPYSSGMLMRLAIATARPADIVLIDEAMGTGDAAFYEKTQERLGRFLSESSLLVLITHSE
jgi:ABC-type polysaccharide/polyol phosphate transport system ATPase subunit